MAGRRWALLLAIVLLGGCAHVQDVTGVATQQDVLQLQTDVTIAQQRSQRALGEAEAALAQVQRRERERDTEAEQRLTALGQRVEAFALDAWTNNEWQEFARGTSIGNCKLVRGKRVTTTKVRLRITQAPVCPAISELALFAEP